ncbi:MAG: FABP family protein [Aggregatilineales bacterium]
MSDVMGQLRQLVGTWEGIGRGTFPTIDPFEYTEKMVIHAIGNDPLLYYEQYTWRNNASGQKIAAHQECGFIRPISGNSIELTNGQNSGRTEILVGTIEQRGTEIFLNLTSKHIAYDERMIASSRVFRLVEGQLEYSTGMATVSVPQIQPHLHATLQKVVERVAECVV